MVDVDGSHEHQIDEAAFLGWPRGRRTAGGSPGFTPTPTSADRPSSASLTPTARTPRCSRWRSCRSSGLQWDAQAPCVGWSADGRYVIGILTPDNTFADRLIELDPDTGESQIIAAPPPFVMAWSQQRLAP